MWSHITNRQRCMMCCRVSVSSLSPQRCDRNTGDSDTAQGGQLCRIGGPAVIGHARLSVLITDDLNLHWIHWVTLTVGGTPPPRHVPHRAAILPRASQRHVRRRASSHCAGLVQRRPLESLEPPSVRQHHVHQAAEAAVSRISIDSSADHDSGTYSQDSGYMDSGHLTCRNTM